MNNFAFPIIYQAYVFYFPKFLEIIQYLALCGLQWANTNKQRKTLMPAATKCTQNITYLLWNVVDKDVVHQYIVLSESLSIDYTVVGSICKMGKWF